MIRVLFLPIQQVLLHVLIVRLAKGRLGIANPPFEGMCKNTQEEKKPNQICPERV